MTPARPARRRWFQFSVGTMFVVLTAVALCAHNWTLATRRQREAVAIVQRHNGIVLYDFDEEAFGPSMLSGTPKGRPWKWMIDVFGIDAAANVVTVNVDGITNAEFKQLMGMSELRMLRIGSLDVTDDAMPALARLHHGLAFSASIAIVVVATPSVEVR